MSDRVGRPAVPVVVVQLRKAENSVREVSQGLQADMVGLDQRKSGLDQLTSVNGLGMVENLGKR